MAFPPARVTAMLGEEVKRVTGRDFRINGELSIRLLPTLSVVANDVALSNADWGTRPEMVTLQHVAFEIALLPLLDGEIRILSIKVKGADVFLETDGKGRFNWMFTSSEAKAGKHDASMPVIDPERLTLSGMRIAYRDAEKGTVRGVTIEKLEMQLQGNQVEISAALEFEHQRWQVDGQMGRLAGLLASEANWPFELRFVTAGAKLLASGKIGSEKGVRTDRAELSLQISGVEALSALFASDVMLPLPLDMSATLLRTSDSIRADPLRVAHAGQEMNGQITVLGSGDNLRVEGQLSSPLIEVERWFVAKPLPATAAAKGTAQLFGDAPLPFAALPTTPLQLDFRVDQLLLPGVSPLSAVSGQLKVEPNLLVINPLSLTVEGGHLRGRIEVVQHAGAAP
ncbi:MAG TPA: AsmA family protein, partial [Azonexus sp.]|nr:AsmA family protein [Azonexus sp.]